MSDKETKKNLLYIIKNVILDEKIDLDIPDEDWSELMSEAKLHDVVGVIGPVSNLAPDAIRREFLKYNAFAVSRHFTFESEIEKIRNAFGSSKIPFMLLKGNVVKKLYPNPEMRSMGDIDILVKNNDVADIRDIMAGLGYLVKLERPDEVTYFKPPFVTIEIHTQMVSDVHSKINSYYGDGWKFARLKADCEFEYEMKREDFFVFQVAHYAKHYATSGAGIRSVIDIWILLREWGRELDFEYVNEQLRSLGLEKFCEKLRQLIHMWFEDGEKMPDLNDMENYIFGSGVHGSSMQRTANKEIRAKSKVIYKIKKYFSAVFLKRQAMEGFYPSLKKRPWLLPYFWIKRLISRIFSGRVKNFFDKEKEMAEKWEANKIKEHFEKLGLL